MANEQNLTPFTSEQSREEAVKNGKKGGIASGQARREKADFKRKCQLWMDNVVAKDENGTPMTGAELMVKVAGREIYNGNSKFWELMRDTAGYKPVDKVMVAEVDQGVINEVESLVLGGGTEDANENTSS